MIGDELEERMVNILLVSTDRDRFADMIAGLKRRGAGILDTDKAQTAYELISKQAFDLVIVDESIDDEPGLQVAKHLIAANPVTNLALISDLPPKAFHQETEGMGVLAQVPRQPDEAQTADLLNRLKTVLGLDGR